MRDDIERQYARLRSGLRPIGEAERLVAQAIADGAHSMREIAAVTGRAFTHTHKAILNLRGKGIVLPAPGVIADHALTIAPGYVVHNNEIYQLMKVGAQ